MVIIFLWLFRTMPHLILMFILMFILGRSPLRLFPCQRNKDSVYPLCPIPPGIVPLIESCQAPGYIQNSVCSAQLPNHEVIFLALWGAFFLFLSSLLPPPSSLLTAYCSLLTNPPFLNLDHDCFSTSQFLLHSASRFIRPMALGIHIMR